jgi:hypothetical protein
MYIVTGASDNHFRSLCQFLRSIPTQLLSNTFVWNLGLSESNQASIVLEFPMTRMRHFPYHEYPSYFNIHVAAGEYAWKPVVIAKTAEEIMDAQVLLWCDAGNRQMGTFDAMEATVKSQGVYTPISLGTVRKWTHPSCLEYFKVQSTDPVLNMLPRNAAIVGFDLANTAAVEFMKEWAQLAQIKECIAPEGSNRENHRQDQAVLTLLYYRYTGNQHLMNSEFTMATHQDCD